MNVANTRANTPTSVALGASSRSTLRRGTLQKRAHVRAHAACGAASRPSAIAALGRLGHRGGRLALHGAARVLQRLVFLAVHLLDQR
eukprot:549470-Prymnesium_polylepis.2